MRAWELVRVFEMYHRLLGLHEPHEAVLWLIQPNVFLENKQPCELLGTPEGYQRVRSLIEETVDNSTLL